MRINAGKVNITPAANDSPADAEVCTKLCSKILEFLKNRIKLIDIIAAGIDADTVMPAKRPKYALADDSIIDKTIPRNIALNDNSVLLLFILYLKIIKLL